MSRPHSDRASDLTVPAGVEDSDAGAVVQGLQRGDVVGRYVILARVGAGGMGVVYAAYDPGLDRKVALKVLHPELRAEGERLLREAQSMARLAHPNVVAVHDVGEHDGAVFLAMEYIDGSTLRRFLAARPRSWRTVVRAFVQAGRGLAAAHAKGLVHRDFKPDNAMVDDEGAESDDGPARVRVLDFGLARGAPPTAREGDDPPAHPETSRAGTPAYMAPEQFQGETVGPAADQFAFCVSLFEGLYGERPFEGGTVAALALSVRTGRVRATSGSEVPTWVRRVIERGLAVDPEARWPSMHALLRALERDPTRRRRITFGLFAAIAIAGAVFGVREIDRGRRIAACDDEAEAIADVWNQDVAAAIEHAFTRSDLPYATDAWTRAKPRFDAFAGAWAQARAQVCRSGVVERTRDARALGLAEDCLAEQRGRLEAIAAQLRAASPGAVERSVEWSLALPDPRECTDDDALRRRTPPDDPAVRRELVAMHGDRATIGAMVDAGDVAGAQALADDLRARAEALEWPPAVAMAEVTWADVARAAGEPSAGITALEHAFAIAGGAGDDVLAAEAAGDLAYILGHELARAQEGRVWAHVAQTLVDRSDLPAHDPIARSVSNAVGAVRMAEGAVDEATRVYARLVAVAREHLGPDHPSLAMALLNLGAAESQRSRHAEARRLFEEALAIRERTLGPEHPSVATCLVNLSVVLTALGRAEEALVPSQRALEIRLAIYGPDHPKVVTSQANLAAALSGLGRHAQAVALGTEMLARQRRTRGERHPDVASTLQTLGVSYASLQREEESIAALTEAIEIFRETRGPTHHATALAVHALAHAYAILGRRDEAMAGYREALALLETLSGAQRQTAAALGSLGALEVDGGAVQSGLDRCERVLVLLGDVERARELAMARACVARALWRLGRDHARAIDLVRSARQQLADDERERTSIEQFDAWLEHASAVGGGEPPPALPPLPDASPPTK